MSSAGLKLKMVIGRLRWDLLISWSGLYIFRSYPMRRVVPFWVFFPPWSNSSAVWAQTKAHQEHSNAASIFFMIAPYRWWDKLYPEPLFLLRPVLVRILLGRNWNPRCPFQPSLRRLLVQGEYRPAPYRPGLR